MNTLRLKSVLKTVRGLGPYLLVELLLPGGTLIAVLLWLAQNGGRRQNMKARAQPVARTVAALRLMTARLQDRQPATRPALALLTFQQERDNLRHDRSGTLIELRSRQVRDRMGHREKTKIRQAPGARHGAAGYFEHVRHDRGGGNAVLFENYAVEHTARAA